MDKKLLIDRDVKSFQNPDDAKFFDSLTDEEWKFYNSHYEWWQNYRKELFSSN